ncbi:MAG: alanyl-tRNA synthetase [Candidatus Parcubacteria bacterium]|jgi:alanyl-tRNA synthetase|nr:alanyl-tRNA synthetase [Candidatus Parcubacteria bacterium]
MIVSEVRSRYLKFFAERGHTIIPSAPIVPGNDSTTLFTSSGMQPMVPYLLGQDHPEGTRLTNSQLSFRAGDIEEVGDNRHTTFFEMLGNWSLGDYTKREQIPWIFEFLTNKEKGLGLDPARLYVSVFAGDPSIGIGKDDKTVALWQRMFTEKGIEAKEVVLGSQKNGSAVGMQEGRIFAYDVKENWWSRAGVPAEMPAGEPGGPDSEMFYDFGTPHDPVWGAHCHPACDCGRFVEIGNSVFMDYKKEPDGSFTELPRKNIDFGGGLERITFATLGSADAFILDVFNAGRSVLESRTGQVYGQDAEATRSFRIILDHVRAAVFILADGVLPSNTEAGYILRRLIRRAIRHADKLGIGEAALAEIASSFVDVYKDAYPDLTSKADAIRNELEKEETKFRKTLKQGMREYEKLAKKGNLSGHDAFVLFSSYGFPVEITEELAQERGIEVDLVAFRAEMDDHQAKSRTASEGRFKGGLADHSDVTVRYHTSHHLLLAALRQLLGDSVHQRGSNITQERVRLDFSFDRKLTPEELKAAEDLVNEKVQEALPVFATSIPKEEAEQLGAEREFGVKYGDQVTVYSMGPKDATAENPKFKESFSLEFCGGPHVSSTKELADGGKSFKIIKEESVAAGIRRIKAVLT